MSHLLYFLWGQVKKQFGFDDEDEETSQLNANTSAKDFVNKRVEVFKDVTYLKDSKDYKHQLNIFKTRKHVINEENSTPIHEDNLPVIFFVHGGSWRRGDRTHRWFDVYSRMATRLCSTFPCIVVNISYRLAPTVTYREQVYDLIQAFTFVRKEIKTFGGNEKNIILMGHSAGSHLIACALLQYGMSLENVNICEVKLSVNDKKDKSEEPIHLEVKEKEFIIDKEALNCIRGIILLCPVTDVQNVSQRHFLVRKFIVEPAFGISENYEKCSPIYYVQHMLTNGKVLFNLPPFYICNAESDLQLEEQGEQFATLLKELVEKYQEKKVNITYKRFKDGTNHFTIVGLSKSMGKMYDPLFHEIVQFIKETLHVPETLVHEEVTETFVDNSVIENNVLLTENRTSLTTFEDVGKLIEEQESEEIFEKQTTEHDNLFYQYM
ncbi:hypothetical protein ABK040_008799 [Willaertia magna]